ncbi:ribonuclease P protein subunit p20 isoform X1 [Phyllostomus discolor]|uniref:Ribonuclease P protein subunit p20 n=2 Tax=Phyllostomus discolor TaxID=89673 RepID=A0A6J2MNF5_9CHIR|nr:ribonuclease P protein subunit p20 isoform X1 [Phyllostomus discolor]
MRTLPFWERCCLLPSIFAKLPFSSVLEVWRSWAAPSIWASRHNATHSMAENREHRGAIEAELDPVEYTLRKRLPHRLPRRPNDIYVNMKTDFKAQLARCQKLLDGGSRGQNACTEIYIHGLGLAINRAINIALQLQAGSFGSLQVAANTSTVELVDELEPETDTQEPLTRIRNNSAIHIRVFRVTPK